MPLNVRRFGASCLVFLLLAGAVIAQATGASGNEDMKQRLTRARAFVAVRSYTAAAFELEKIRKESTDPSVQSIALTLLMNCYLENGDYKHSQDLLNETFAFVKTAKGNSSSSYFTISGQLLKMARAQLERYKQLGLNIADPDIPTEVSAEIEKMRGTLELVVTQAKELSDSNKRSAEAFGLLEEVTNTRSSMARDAYDATRWKNEVADARERLANSQSLVINVVDEPANSAANVAQNIGPANTTPNILNTGAPATVPIDTNSKPQGNAGSDAARDIPKEVKPQTGNPLPNIADQKAKADTSANTANNTAANTLPTNSAGANLTPNVSPNVSDAGGDKPKTRTRTSGEKSSQSDPAQSTAGVKSDPLATSVGSLVDMATKKVSPVYPQIARNMRVGGVVRVDLVVDEQGAVLSAQAVQGPEMLKRAAMDAVKQWKFKPVMIDGQATKASGFINFNFSL